MRENRTSNGSNQGATKGLSGFNFSNLKFALFPGGITLGEGGDGSP